MGLNNIHFIIHSSHRPIWNMTGGVDEEALELIWQGCGGTSDITVVRESSPEANLTQDAGVLICIICSL